MLFNIPTAQTIRVIHPTIPITPVIVLILFLIISLIFHLVEKGKCLNIPFVVIFKFLFFTFGSSFLNDSAGFFLNSFKQVKYVINDIPKITNVATK